MIDFAAGKLKVRIYENRKELGAAAAKMAAASINNILQKKEIVNIVFAAAASQNEFLASIIKEDVDWRRINAFHMDEYIGLEKNAPQHFSHWLKEKIFDKLPFKELFFLNGNAENIGEECLRYTTLLKKHPLDINFMGIGENAHLAFNDPHVADFNDPYFVKVVDLDKACKQQQVNEDCFKDISEVPSYALTLTIPALLQAEHIFCMVPGNLKAQAVYHTIMSDVSELYPSTVLRNHDDAYLFLEKESAAMLLAENDIQNLAITKPVNYGN
ncbi:6-phosphogluconolactonase [Parafilimonas sp.]|uniref:6-phosphogluconolactonase n=1 Tax=Parafilimonas sp. TaxID=1969739 RepID=UPI0039E4337B